MRSLHPWSFFPSNLSPSAARSMALQFAIREIASCFEKIHEIEELAPLLIQGERWPKELTTLLKELDQILLVNLTDPFGQKGGALDRLAFYASKMGTPSPEIALLSTIEAKILHSRERFSQWRGRPFPERETVLQEIQTLAESAKSLLEQFLLSLMPALEEARFDENVLFSLVEERDRINLPLHQSAVEKIFSKLYPSGPGHLRAILHEGYSRRGFGDFYTKHEALIESVSWETESVFQ